MDTQGLFIIFSFTAIIILYLKTIKEIIIPAKKSKLEITIIIISASVIFFIILLLGKTWVHYVVGSLAIVLILLILPRKGITSKGFQSVKGITWGHWNKLKSVRVVRNKEVKVSFYGRYVSHDEHYYDVEDYDKIMKILQGNISPKILKIDSTI